MVKEEQKFLLDKDDVETKGKPGSTSGIINEAEIEENNYQNRKRDRYKLFEKDKYKILVIVSLTAVIAPFSGSIFLPALTEIQEEFGASNFEITMLISIGFLAAAVFKLVWGPVSDKYSRKWVITGCMFFAIFMAYAQALARHIWWLFVFRIFWSIPISGLFVVVAGIISDTFPPEKRGFAMGLRGLPMLFSAIFASPLGGLLVYYFSWRSTVLLVSVLCTILFLLNLYLVPETLDKQEAKKKKLNLLEPIFLIFNHKIFIVILMQCGSIISMFIMLIAMPIALPKVYDSSSLVVGFSLLPFGIGAVLGGVVGGKLSDITAKKYGAGRRLIPSFVGLVLCSITVILFGWSFELSIWYPITLMGLSGFARSIAGPGIITYSISVAPRSAAAVNACLSLSFLLSVFVVLSVSTYFVDLIGFEYWNTLVGIGLFVLSLPSLYIIIFDKRNISAYRTPQTLEEVDEDDVDEIINYKS
eukprot:TRINITY_DN6634_c0_g1_i1.p1 TRINITY_DN6634_c0_g1~~TRINITY_DN6634_c0_g1_i1.p1  ORF type:complete len:473 (-),score=127.55 TRINITY_DN6634_c0_g1_i1:186-1604(-)